MNQVIEVSSYITLERVLDLYPKDKEDLIDTMINSLEKCSSISDISLVRKAMWAREKLGSTAIGHGIAIPHARCSGTDSFVVAFARVKEGIDFGAEDGTAVKIVFMIVASDAMDKEYIRLLSRLMLRLRNDAFVDQLLSAPDSEAMYRLLVNTR